MRGLLTATPPSTRHGHGLRGRKMRVKQGTGQAGRKRRQRQATGREEQEQEPRQVQSSRGAEHGRGTGGAVVLSVVGVCVRVL